jgi:hypothetical protein
MDGMSTWVFEQNVEPGDVKVEDSGHAKIVEIGNDRSDLFLRLQSWADDGKHGEFDQIIGTRIRITVETF